MKSYKIVLLAAMLLLVVLAIGCSTPAPRPRPQPRRPRPPSRPLLRPLLSPKTYADMTLCFPQLGAEKRLGTADTNSFKDTAAKLGIKKVGVNGMQTRSRKNQISAMRACIQQGVDVVALPPVVEDGWETVLTEAKNAKIPVIIVDRSVSADASLYAAHIGSDMELEGKTRRRRNEQVAPQWRLDS